METSILPATVLDAPAILALQRLAFQSEASLYGDFSIPPLTQTLEELQAEFDRQTILKAVGNGMIVGSVRAQMQDTTTCAVGRLIVHPDRQGQGIGTRLMQEIEKYFPQSQRFELFTGHKSARNLRLYERLGYREFRRQAVSSNATLVFLEKENREMGAHAAE
jgi:ribosomal protein S18 acetylase RimI-like enzyme